MTKEERYYYSEYSKTQEVYLRRTLKTIETHISEIPILDECIGFQIWLDEQISNVFNGEIDKFRELHIATPNIAKQLVLAFSLFRRNHQYLLSAFELAYPGLCEPAYNNLRTVHESILAMWYIVTHAEESTEIIEYMFNNRRQGTQYSHNHFLTALYEGEMEESMRNIYSGLSLKAHSNIFGMKNTEQYSVEQVQDCFWSIRTQSYYNIVTCIETLAQDPDLHIIVLGQDVKLFIYRLQQEMAGDAKTIPNYFPNKGNWKTREFFLYDPNK